MHVTLISTVHGDSGRATSEALVALLERLKPRVVFAEIPKEKAKQYTDGSHGNLESLAVADFATRHPIVVVAVDHDEPDEQFFRSTKVVFDRVERVSRDYRNLCDSHSAAVRTGGLRYLNSEECVQACLNLHNEVRASIEYLRATELHPVYDSWIEKNDLRDRVMLANIAAFAADSELATGVFLVGAAHRNSILEKVRSGLGGARAQVDWQLELPSALFE